jgi:hypothetical protein
MSDIEFQELWYLTYGAIGIACGHRDPDRALEVAGHFP